MQLDSLSKLYSGTSLVKAAYVGSNRFYRNISAQSAVNGFVPELCFDFAEDAYAIGSKPATFDDSITHSASSNATMVDSDGVLKWRPHNLCLQSEDFGTDAGWAWTRSTVTADQIAAPDGSVTADYLEQESGNTSAGAVGRTVVISGAGAYTWAVFAKAAEKTRVRVQLTGSNYAYFDVENGTAGTAVGCTTSITDYGGGWYLCAISASISSNPFALVYNVDGESLSVVGSGGIYIWGAHAYRSDLGGMVDNPDTGNSYVPTTSAARYLPRRGHHVYNGSAWVNEGLLHESEARTNLIVNSQNFALWTDNSGNITQTASADTSPDGGTNAYVVSDTGSGDDFISVFTSVSANTTTYTYSLFVKKTVGDAHYMNIAIAFFGGTIAYGQGTFDTNLGVFSAVQGNIVAGSALVEDNGGWWRISISSANNGTGTSVQTRLYPAHNADGTTTRNNALTGAKTVFGAQLEAAPTPSSYIPTAGSTVTRAADSMTIPAANLPYSATAISIQMDGRVTYTDEDVNNQNMLYDWVKTYGVAEIYASIETDAGAGIAEFVQFNNNAATIVQSDVYSSGVLVPYSVAARHGSNFVNAAADGTAFYPAAHTLGLPDLSTNDLRLGPFRTGFIGQNYMGTIRTFRMWDQDITDAGIEEATT